MKEINYKYLTEIAKVARIKSRKSPWSGDFS
jgi:hypothetical protein